MPYETIRYDVDAGLGRLVLARPDRRNALDPVQARELADVAVRASQDQSLRALLVTATGPAFHVGGDLKHFAGVDDTGATIRDMTMNLHAAVSRLVRMDAPVVMAVQGAAAGAGMSLAISGDLVLAGASASFTMAYTAAGLVPDGSATWFLPRLVGQRRAAELMFTNRRLTATEALDWGLITRVVADDDLVVEAETLATELAAGPTVAFGATKSLLRTSLSATLETQMEDESQAIAHAAGTADGQEGIAAFLAKRRPEFTGR